MLQSRSFVRIGHKCKYKEHQTSWVYENHTSKQLWNKSHKHPPTLDEQEKVFTDYDFYFRTPVYNAWIASIQHRAFLSSILNIFFLFSRFFFVPRAVRYVLHWELLSNSQFYTTWQSLNTKLTVTAPCCVRGETKFVWRKFFAPAMKYIEKRARCVDFFSLRIFHTQ